MDDQAKFQFLAHAELTPTETGSVRFSGVLYSGQRITDHWAWGNGVVFDMDTMDIPASVPVLANHDPSCELGVTHEFVKSDGVTVGGEIFADLSDDAAKVTAFAKRGFPYQMSPYIIPGSVEEVPAGQEVTVNGQQFAGPVSVFRNSRIREVSIVATGADHRTAVSVFQASGRANDMSAVDEKARIAELEAQLADAQSKFSASATEVDALKAEISELRGSIQKQASERREADIKALFTAIGRPYTEEAGKPYMGLADESFAAIADDLKARLAAPEGNLFGRTTDGAAPENKAPKLDPRSIYAARAGK